GAATISSSSHRLVLSPELAADQEFIARFRREARALSEINHPNISSAAQPRSHRGRADRGGVLVCDVLPTIASTFPESLPRMLRVRCDSERCRWRAHSSEAADDCIRPKLTPTGFSWKWPIGRGKLFCEEQQRIYLTPTGLLIEGVYSNYFARNLAGAHPNPGNWWNGNVSPTLLPFRSTTPFGLPPILTLMKRGLNARGKQ